MKTLKKKSETTSKTFFLNYFFGNFNKKNKKTFLNISEFSFQNALFYLELETHCVLGEIILSVIIAISKVFFGNQPNFFKNEILYFSNLFYVNFPLIFYKNIKSLFLFFQYKGSKFSFGFFLAIFENLQRRNQTFIEFKWFKNFFYFLFKNEKTYKHRKLHFLFLGILPKPFYGHQFFPRTTGKIGKKSKNSESIFLEIRNWGGDLLCSHFRQNWKCYDSQFTFKSAAAENFFFENLGKKSQKFSHLKKLFFLRKIHLTSASFLINPFWVKLFFFFTLKKKQVSLVALIGLLPILFFSPNVVGFSGRGKFKCEQKKKTHLKAIKLSTLTIFVENLFTKIQKLEPKTKLISILTQLLKIRPAQKFRKKKEKELGLFFWFLALKIVFHQTREPLDKKREYPKNFHFLEKMKEIQFYWTTNSFSIWGKDLEMSETKTPNFKKNPEHSFIFFLSKKANEQSFNSWQVNFQTFERNFYEKTHKFAIFHLNGVGYFSGKKIPGKRKNIRKLLKQLKIFSILERSFFFINFFLVFQLRKQKFKPQILNPGGLNKKTSINIFLSQRSSIKSFSRKKN